jgi:hypothetical protein
MSDTILDLMTRVNIEPLKSAMTEASTSVAASTDKMKASFASFNASSVAANEGVRTMLSTLPPEFIKVEAGGVFAFEQIKRRVIEATSEVGALRQEILTTNDAAKLQQLNAQLDQARARMTAARTEMRAMRMEMTETREKADLLGESLGVKIPGSLGRLLGQIPLLQTAMNAAFAPLVVLFFADAIIKVVEWIDHATDSLAGYTEEVKKAFEEEKKHNQEQLRHVGSVREGMEKIIETNRRVSEVGKSSFASFEESAKKAKAETSGLLNVLTLGLVEGYRTLEHVLTDVAHEQVVLSETAREQMKGLMEVAAAENRAALKNKENLESAGQIGKSRISQLREELKALNEKQELETKIAVQEAAGKKDSDAADLARARANVEEEFAAKRLAVQRHIAEEFANISIAAAKSEVAARQAIESQFISFYESGLHQMYAAGQITLADEIAGEKAAAQQRLAIRLTEIEQQKALALREQAATGKDATPELTTLDEKGTTAKIQTQQKLNELTQRGALDTLRQQNEINLATVQAAKTVADAEINAVEQSARAQLAARRISLEQETEISKAAAAQRIDSDIAVAKERLRQEEEFPERNKKLIIQLNADIVALEKQKVAELERIDAEYTNKHLEEVRRDMEETLRFVEETSNRELSSALSTDDKRLKSHQITLFQWGALERAQVERWAAEQSVALNAMLEKEKAMYGQDSLEYKKLIDKKNELDQQRLQKLNQIDQQILSKEEQTFNKISDGFATAAGQILQRQKTFGQAMVGVWNNIEVSFVEMLTRMITQAIIKATIMKAVMAIFGQAPDPQQQAAENTAVAESKIQANTAQAASDVFLQAIEAVPFPANLAAAPAAAAAVEAMMAPFAGQAAAGGAGVASAAGGMDVQHDQLAFLHKREVVLPESIAQNFRAIHGSGTNTSSAAAGGSRPGPGFGSSSSTSRTVTNHIRPTIIVNHPGQKVTQEDIEAAVLKGIRRNALTY